MTEQKTKPALPAGVQEKHIQMAQWMDNWYELRSKVSSGMASPDESSSFKSVPTVAGRPLWVSELSEQDRTALQKASNFLHQQ